MKATRLLVRNTPLKIQPINNLASFPQSRILKRSLQHQLSGQIDLINYFDFLTWNAKFWESTQETNNLNSQFEILIRHTWLTISYNFKLQLQLQYLQSSAPVLTRLVPPFRDNFERNQFCKIRSRGQERCPIGQGTRSEQIREHANQTNTNWSRELSNKTKYSKGGGLDNRRNTEVFIKYSFINSIFTGNKTLYRVQTSHLCLKCYGCKFFPDLLYKKFYLPR